MKKILSLIKDSYIHIPYTFKHVIAFCKCEKELTGKIRFKSAFHDVDKLMMYIFIPFCGSEIIGSFHRSYSSHHSKKATDILSMVVDWECARFTKPDKPLTAEQTLYKYYPELEDKIIPMLKQLNLV